MSIFRLPIDAETADETVYRQLAGDVMDSGQLWRNGYPKMHPGSSEEGKALVPPPTHQTARCNFSSNRRTCTRCHTEFVVKLDGTPVTPRPCHFHPARFNTKYSSYPCCRSGSVSQGCSVSDGHAINGSTHKDYERGFQQTRDLSDASDKVFALDTEMVETTIGRAVAKITLIDWRFNVVYETLVKPWHPILDHNTKFSGIKKGDLDKVEVTLTQAQDRLLEIVSAKSILIGHSLHHDLIYLKMVHQRVIDTMQVFPDPRGLPFRLSLKTVVLNQLGIRIQSGNHDSKEDAVACMHIMLHKRCRGTTGLVVAPAKRPALELFGSRSYGIRSSKFQKTGGF